MVFTDCTIRFRLRLKFTFSPKQRGSHHNCSENINYRFIFKLVSMESGTIESQNHTCLNIVFVALLNQSSVNVILTCESKLIYFIFYKFNVVNGKAIILAIYGYPPHDVYNPYAVIRNKCYLQKLQRARSPPGRRTVHCHNFQAMFVWFVIPLLSVNKLINTYSIYDVWVAYMYVTGRQTRYGPFR